MAGKNNKNARIYHSPDIVLGRRILFHKREWGRRIKLARPGPTLDYYNVIDQILTHRSYKPALPSPKAEPRHTPQLQLDLCVGLRRQRHQITATRSPVSLCTALAVRPPGTTTWPRPQPHLSTYRPSFSNCLAHPSVDGYATCTGC